MPRVFVPGRVCLLGAHSVWAGARAVRDGPGACVVVGTREGVSARRDAGEGPRFRVVGADGDAFECDVSVDDALEREASSGGYWSYVAGTALEVLRRFPRCRERGLVVETLETTLPTRKGLSSSACVCVLVARCFGVAYELDLELKDEMELAYRGEAVHTPSKCGAMDQACAYGSERVVALTFDGEDVDVRACEVDGEIHIVVCDLAASKSTVRILADLQGAFDRGDEALRSALGARNRALVAEGLDAIKRGDARALGAVYTRAQTTFDEAAIHICPSELTAPRLRETLAAVAHDVPETVFGAKGVGSQGDGAAQFVAVSEAAAKTLRQYLHDFSGGRFKVFDVVLRDEERHARTSTHK